MVRNSSVFDSVERSVGMHVFHMSKKIGEMSRGEINFVLCCVVISLVADNRLYTHRLQ